MEKSENGKTNDCDALVGYIYLITNLVNDKCYVGQTVTTLHKRFTEHKRCARTNQSTASLLYKAIKKYGEENFEISELSCIHAPDRAALKDRLNVLEAYWIRELNTKMPAGYNMTPGGDSFSEHVSCPVFQVTEDGDVIASFVSMCDAERQNGLPLGSIKRGLVYGSHYANGYYWYLHDELSVSVGDNIGYQESHYRRPVFCFDLSGNMLNSFKSISDAVRYYGLKSNKISSACSGERKSTGGMLWSYDETPPVYESSQKTHRCRPVVQMDDNGNVIHRYASATDAARRLNLCQSLISKCCQGQRKSTGGFRWAFS